MAYRLSYSHLLREFGALGPYLCPEQCEPDRFFFDSRNPALFPRHSGLGWWLLLEPCEGGFSGQSELAGYSATGIWLNRPVPRTLWPELASSRDQFLGRVEGLCRQWRLELLDIERRELGRLTSVLS